MLLVSLIEGLSLFSSSISFMSTYTMLSCDFDGESTVFDELSLFSIEFDVVGVLIFVKSSSVS